MIQPTPREYDLRQKNSTLKRSLYRLLKHISTTGWNTLCDSVIGDMMASHSFTNQRQQPTYSFSSDAEALETSSVRMWELRMVSRNSLAWEKKLISLIVGWERHDEQKKRKKRTELDVFLWKKSKNRSMETGGRNIGVLTADLQISTTLLKIIWRRTFEGFALWERARERGEGRGGEEEGVHE